MANITVTVTKKNNAVYKNVSTVLDASKISGIFTKGSGSTFLYVENAEEPVPIKYTVTQSVSTLNTLVSNATTDADRLPLAGGTMDADAIVKNSSGSIWQRFNSAFWEITSDGLGTYTKGWFYTDANEASFGYNYGGAATNAFAALLNLVTIKYKNAAHLLINDLAMSIGVASKPTYINGSKIVTSPDAIPTYANDAAADSDAGLPQFGLYKLTGNRTIFQKP